MFKPYLGWSVLMVLFPGLSPDTRFFLLYPLLLSGFIETKSHSVALAFLEQQYKPGYLELTEIHLPLPP